VHDGLGVSLSAQPHKTIASKPILLKEVSLSNPKFIMMDDTEQWVELSGFFIAKGGEQYITIGNFKDDTELRIIRRIYLLFLLTVKIHVVVLMKNYKK
jgi:hypothetical protein